MTNILVIEDETELRNNIAQVLSLEGYHVAEAPDGARGYQAAQEIVPDLIISDITMPEMDGYQVLVALRENPKTSAIPLIFLTARAERPFMRHGMELGADDYLAKPFTNAELVAAVRTRLHRHENIAESLKDSLAPTRKKLTRIVAHELNTPLASIMLAQDMMKRHWESLTTDQVEGCLDTLYAGSRRLNRVIEQFVLMMKIESGFLEIDATNEDFRVDTTTAIQQAVTVARRIAYRNAETPVEVFNGAETASVIGHMPSLVHALAEIVGNAMVYSPERSVVTIRQHTQGGNVIITIADQGRGFNVESLDEAFEAFGQVDRDSNEQQGLGLGLTIARQIIQAHRGQLHIKSVLDEGTEVKISLPV